MRQPCLFRLYRLCEKRYSEGMELLYGCAMLIEGLLVLGVLIAVLSIPGRIDRILAELARTNATLAVVDSNLDAIRAQLVETKRLVAGIAQPTPNGAPQLPPATFEG